VGIYTHIYITIYNKNIYIYIYVFIDWFQTNIVQLSVKNSGDVTDIVDS
jgi:hypothetical protein